MVADVANQQVNLLEEENLKVYGSWRDDLIMMNECMQKEAIYAN